MNTYVSVMLNKMAAVLNTANFGVKFADVRLCGCEGLASV